MRHRIWPIIVSGMLTASAPACVSSPANRGSTIGLGLGVAALGALTFNQSMNASGCQDGCDPSAPGAVIGMGLMGFGLGTAVLNAVFYFVVDDR